VRRILPAGRGARIAVIVLAVLVALVLLYGWVFPWVDRTFVNRPQIGVVLLR
jgi:hypothetical protein